MKLVLRGLLPVIVCAELFSLPRFFVCFVFDFVCCMLVEHNIICIVFCVLFDTSETCAKQGVHSFLKCVFMTFSNGK